MFISSFPFPWIHGLRFIFMITIVVNNTVTTHKNGNLFIAQFSKLRIWAKAKESFAFTLSLYTRRMRKLLCAFNNHDKNPTRFKLIFHLFLLMFYDWIFLWVTRAWWRKIIRHLSFSSSSSSSCNHHDTARNKIQRNKAVYVWVVQWLDDDNDQIKTPFRLTSMKIKVYSDDELSLIFYQSFFVDFVPLICGLKGVS